MSTQIDLYSSIGNPVDDCLKLGKPFAVMFGLSSIDHGAALAFTCYAERMTPLEVLRTYDFVLGKLRKKALAIYAEFRQKGGKVKWIDTGKDGKKAVAEFTFEGQTVTESFTIEEAKAQDLVKKDSAWVKTPGNMLRARVLSNAIAMLCPEIVAGLIDSGDDAPAGNDPLLSAPAQSPAAPPTKTEKPANVVKVETVAPTPAAAPAQKQPEIEWADFKNPKKVSEQGLAAIFNLIPVEEQDDVVSYLKAIKSITDDPHDLTPRIAKSIFDGFESFMTYVRKHAAEKGQQ